MNRSQQIKRQLAVRHIEDFDPAQADTRYPPAPVIVDGRAWDLPVPNTSSIESTFTACTILHGIREVPLAEFNADPHDLFYDATDFARVRELAEAIRQSGKISPLIVVAEADGPYVLEGVHRLGALYILGAKSFPAMIVIDQG